MKMKTWPRCTSLIPQRSMVLRQATFVHTHQTLHARSTHSLLFGLFYGPFTLDESESKDEKEQAKKDQRIRLHFRVRTGRLLTGWRGAIQGECCPGDAVHVSGGGSAVQDVSQHLQHQTMGGAVQEGGTVWGGGGVKVISNSGGVELVLFMK